MKEPIKITVEVSVNLSESTQNFIKSLFTCSCKSHGLTETAKEESKVIEEPKAKATKAVKEEPKAVEEEPKAVEEEPKAVEEEPKTIEEEPKTIEEVRAVLSQKVNEHRDAIREKLNSLGAPSVTKLDPAKYNEMYAFLIAL